MGKIAWETYFSRSGERGHVLACRGEYKGHTVYKEVITFARKGRLGKPKAYFYLDGDDREFTSEDELIAAIEEGTDR